MTCRFITRKASPNGLFVEKAPVLRQNLSKNLHQGYPTVTKGHKLIGVTPVAKN
jgi:hypothetical protein